MGVDAKNREGVELIHAWGHEKYHWDTAVESVGREMVLPLPVGAMKEAGFKDIRTSINNRQNTVAQYIATRPLLVLCKGTNHIGGG